MEDVLDDPTKGGGDKRFDFTINVSHVIVLLGFVSTVIGLAVTMRDNIRDVSSDLKQTVVELRAENKTQDQAIIQLRSDLTTSKTEDANFRAEQRASNVDLGKLLTTIQIQTAVQGAHIK